MAKLKNPEIEIRKGGSGRDLAYVGASRIRVADIAQQYALVLDELIVERIHASLPTITEEQIHAAIEYWREHEDEIDEVIRADLEALDQIPVAGSE